MDVLLLIVVALLVGFGLLMVYSSSFIYAQERAGNGYQFILKQVLFALAGGVALVLASRMNYRRWFSYGYPLLAGATVLLALVLIPGIGTKVGGAQRWIRIGGMGFQPGELAKVAIIVFVAMQLERKRDSLHRFVPGVISPWVVPLPALLMLLLQPDFGSTVMIGISIFCLMFIAGVPGKFLAAAMSLAVAAGSFLALSTAYRRDRILAFLDPWRDPGGKGFQILQSFVGLHNGGVSGVGLGNGKEKLFYLPEAHNDFIFSVIGEELGFLGILGVVAAYLYFIYRGLRIAWNCYKGTGDLFGTYLATGITLMLGLQGFVNMCVALGLVPTKGLALPFISYGGSALVVDLLAVGILLSVARGPGSGARVEKSRSLAVESRA